MQKIIITGAAGLIGSGVVRYLNDQGETNLVLVDVLDHPQKKKNLQGKKYKKLLSIEALFPYLQRQKGEEIKGIIHLGACSDTMEQNALYLERNNTLYTRKLAEYALERGIRFIYASSAATYGDGALGFSDDHEQLETLRPLNLYAKSKHDFDLWAKKQGVLDRVVGLKYFNVFGPNEAHKGHMASIVYKMVPTIQKEGIVRLFKSTEPLRFGDGDQCRDFIYLKDAVRMTCQFLEDGRGGIYNIGMGKPSMWNQIAKAIFSALGKEAQIQYIDMPQELVSRYQNYTCAKMEKYAQGSDLKLDYDLEAAVRDYVQNYLLTGRAW